MNYRVIDLFELLRKTNEKDNEIFVDPAIGERAMVPLRRMLDFARELQVKVKGNA